MKYEIKPAGSGCGCGGACDHGDPAPQFAYGREGPFAALGLINIDRVTTERLSGTGYHIADLKNATGVAGTFNSHFDTLFKSLEYHLELISTDLLSKAQHAGRFTQYTSADVRSGNPLLLLDVLRTRPDLLGKLDVGIHRSGPADPGHGDECSHLLQKRGTLEQALRDLSRYAEQTERERNECRAEAMRGSRGPARLCTFLGGQYTMICNQDSNSSGCRSTYNAWQDCLGQRLSPDQVASGCDNLASSEPGQGSGAIGALAATLSEMVRRSIREIDGDLAVCRMGSGATNFGPGADTCRNPDGYRDCRRRWDRIIVSLLIIAGIAFIYGAGELGAGILVIMAVFGTLSVDTCNRYCQWRG